MLKGGKSIAGPEWYARPGRLLADCVHRKCRGSIGLFVLVGGGVRGRSIGYVAAALLAALFLATSIATAEAAGGVRLGPVKQFAVAQGLPQNSVNDMVQTRDGYLWLATYGGLARFDGSHFEVFRISTGLSSIRIRSLFEDSKGRLWIGTSDGGINRWENGRFAHLSTCGACEIRGFDEAPDGVVWAATSSGVYRFKPDASSGEKLGGDAHGYTSIAIGPDQHIYATDSTRLFTIESDRIKSLPLEGLQTVDTNTAAGRLFVRRDAFIKKMVSGELFVRTDGGVYRIRGGKLQLMTKMIAETIIQDAAGRLWVSTGDNGLFRENSDGTFDKVAGTPSPMNAASLLFDREGNLWVGSITDGLLRLRPTWIEVLGDPAVGMYLPARAIADDGHGGVWFGLHCGGPHHQAKDGQWSDGLPGIDRYACVRHMLLDSTGALWVGDAEGLHRYDGPRAERIASWTTGGNVDLWQAGRDDFWLNVLGMTRHLRHQDGRWLLSTPVADLQDMSLIAMIPARSGGVWFAGDHGVFRVVNDKVVERWTPKEGLSSRFARALYEDSDGVLWVGTYGAGLNRIEHGQVRHYDTTNGLYDDAVSCILVDDSGTMWMGGNRGVSMLTAEARKQAGDQILVKIFNATDGLDPAELNGGGGTACHRAADGRLYFSLIRGVGVINPSARPDRLQAPLPVHIEQVNVSGKPVDFADGLRLSPGMRDLEIQYTAINLTLPEQTRFRFRLSAHGAHWVDAGFGRSVVFPTIPWGDYEFQVQARRDGEPWPKAFTSLKISRPMPWYQRPWIWLIAVFVALLALLPSIGMDGAGEAKPTRAG